MDLDEFVDLIYRGVPDGHFYFANEIHKQANKAFPKWSKDKAAHVRNLTADVNRITDLYFSPAIYRRPTRPVKANVAGASCVWVDCDAGLPEFTETPNLLVETSPNHFHAYWLLGEFAPLSEIEAINRQLAYQYNTDKSGWDGTQLLRPPGSVNRKRADFQSCVVSVQTEKTTTFQVDLAEHDDNGSNGRVNSGNNPELQAILARTNFPQKVLNLIFVEETSQKEGRSGLLFRTACELLQLGLSNAEAEIVIAFQDARLRKFEHHSDAAAQITGLVRNAREKTGTPAPVGEDKSKPLYKLWKGNKEFLDVETDEEDFIVQDFFYDQGMIVIGGEPGAGKSRLALQLMDCIACGKAFLGKTISRPRRCAYLSLDMNNRRVRDIRKKQALEFTDVEQDLIDENVLLMIRGYGMDLTNKELQLRVEEDLVAADIEVVFVDVLARSVPSMIDDKCAVAFLDWVQRLMVNRKMAFVFVTHTRKGQVGNKTNLDLDDHYGSRHWSIPPDHLYTLANIKGEVRLYVLKDRSGELPEIMYLRKDYGHSFFHPKSSTQQTEESAKAGDGKTDL